MFNPADRIRRAIEWRVNVALDPVREQAERTAGELRVVFEQVDVLRRDVDRLIPQVASLETRLADLREAGGAAGTDATAREHERIRIRLEAVSHYEERLRRLEESLAAQVAGAGEVR